ncbi:DDRGK domain-containing protein 1-like [Argonauta hians]
MADQRRTFSDQPSAWSRETTYLVLVGLLLITILILTLINRWFSSGEPLKPVRADPVPQRVHHAPQVRENIPVGARRKIARRRMQLERDSDEDVPAANTNRRDQQHEGSDDDESIFDNIAMPEGKIGAKKLRKLQEKAEKKAMREQMEIEREEKKERLAAEEEKRKEEERRREKQEAEVEAALRKAKEEQEKREHEEYLKMKAEFTIDEEGEDAKATDLDSESLLEEFINYIKEIKVVMLEDLAHHFSIKTQEAIDRVQCLIGNGTLTGVMDDRGKFIYITMEELKAVAKHIQQRGRVSVQDLAVSSNELIEMNPHNELAQRRLLGEASA